MEAQRLRDETAAQKFTIQQLTSDVRELSEDKQALSERAAQLEEAVTAAQQRSDLDSEQLEQLGKQVQHAETIHHKRNTHELTHIPIVCGGELTQVAAMHTVTVELKRSKAASETMSAQAAAYEARTSAEIDALLQETKKQAEVIRKLRSEQRDQERAVDLLLEEEQASHSHMEDLLRQVKSHKDRAARLHSERDAVLEELESVHQVVHSQQQESYVVAPMQRLLREG